MTKPLSGVELRLAVARVLGQKPPTDIGWMMEGDGSYHCWDGTRMEYLPPAYDTDTNMALEAWKQLKGDRKMNLEIIVDWRGEDTMATIYDTTSGWPIGRAQISEVDTQVATAICRALVAWAEKEAEGE